MKKFLILLMVLAAGFTLDASVALGQATSGQSGTTGRHRGHSMMGGATSPQAFVTKAASDGQFEVELGRLAQEKATDPQAKDLGRMLVDDHTKVNQQLQSIAEKNKLQLATGPQQQLSPKDQKRLEHFRSLSGAEFDRAFVAEVIKDHHEDIKLFEREANKGQNADLKNFAQSTLTGLREHLKHAQGVEASLKGGTQGGATHRHQHGGTTGGATSGGTTGGATGGAAGGATGGAMSGSSGGASGGATGGTTR